MYYLMILWGGGGEGGRWLNPNVSSYNVRNSLDKPQS